MKKWQKLVVIIGLVGALVAVSVSAVHNIQATKRIAELEEQLKDEKLKYKMLYRDPMVRKAIESGG